MLQGALAADATGCLRPGVKTFVGKSLTAVDAGAIHAVVEPGQRSPHLVSLLIDHRQQRSLTLLLRELRCRLGRVLVEVTELPVLGWVGGVQRLC